MLWRKLPPLLRNFLAEPAAPKVLDTPTIPFKTVTGFIARCRQGAKPWSPPLWNCCQKMELEALERGWVCSELLGALAFETIGVISQISNILADANVSIFVLSSYSTNDFLVETDPYEAAIVALEQHGAELNKAD